MTTKEMIAIMQAYEDGKIIEFTSKNENDWEEAVCPFWDWYEFDYRVKPENKYRPYKDTNEMIADWAKRFGVVNWSVHSMPLIWVKEIMTCSSVVMITAFSDHEVVTATITRNMEELFARCTYLDGSHCGKEITE